MERQVWMRTKHISHFTRDTSRWQLIHVFAKYKSMRSQRIINTSPEHRNLNMTAASRISYALYDIT